jgi:predicted TIM-barrel fold metal-dependent hydrolase
MFGTAYPLGTLKESVEATLKLAIADDVMEEYLDGIAARLLKIS